MGNSTNTLSQLSKNFALLKNPFQIVPKPRTPMNWSSTWKPIAKARLFYWQIKKARDFQSTLTLSMDRWQWIVVRPVNSTPKNLVRLVLALSITKLQLLLSSSISRSLKFSSIKEKKYFLVVSSHMRTKMESSSSLEIQPELIMN